MIGGKCTDSSRVQRAVIHVLCLRCTTRNGEQIVATEPCIAQAIALLHVTTLMLTAIVCSIGPLRHLSDLAVAAAAVRYWRSACAAAAAGCLLCLRRSLTAAGRD